MAFSQGFSPSLSHSYRSSPRDSSQSADHPHYAVYAALIRFLETNHQSQLATTLLRQATETCHQGVTASLAALSTNWPLQPHDALVTIPSNSLDDSIRRVASAFVRARRQRRRGSYARLNDSAWAPEEGPLPRSLLRSTYDMLHRVLLHLAAMRPIEVQHRRARLTPMTWEDVLDAATMAAVGHE